ncbi:hypothetical protein KSP35_05975 [Aquihabitans sp. G128]|uniref:hypothetical protein n=1 Tax=Aquihabitans sp. G128 TaxID=2849779 RepID=UPI001C238965|nr:hypothetical protein [Aquihabitans sp. G128]QXC62351.1 hypothetical protein KSP35_05975 [Aquihabitans sp. G128]
MGVLERWDRKNQETLEYHEDQRREGPKGPSGWQWAGTFGAMAVLRQVLDSALGFGPTMAVLVTLAVVLLVIGGITAHRQRQRWQAHRSGRSAPAQGSEPRSAS